MLMLIIMLLLMPILMLMVMLCFRLESHEPGVNLLEKTGDKTSKAHESRVRLKALYEAGEIDQRRLQRSMGAPHSKSSGNEKK